VIINSKTRSGSSGLFESSHELGHLCRKLGVEPDILEGLTFANVCLSDKFKVLGDVDLLHAVDEGFVVCL